MGGGSMGLATLLLFPLLFLGVDGSRLQVLTAPVSQALLGTSARLQCWFDVGGPVALSSLWVTWCLEAQRIASYNPGGGQARPGASLAETVLESGDASLVLAGVTLADEGLYTCVVGYGAEKQQGNTSLRVLAAPRVSVAQRIGSAETALECHIRGFYPAAVDVAWLRDGQLLDSSGRTTPQQSPDGTYNLSLSYAFAPSADSMGGIFSCRVRHQALGEALQVELPLPVTGTGENEVVFGAALGVVAAVGPTAAVLLYGWRKRREGHWDLSGTNVPGTRLEAGSDAQRSPEATPDCEAGGDGKMGTKPATGSIRETK
ncbi:tapasin-related protein-like isoform X2 [Alligator sinensis]|uniref:Tapasin-related protein-like isoform X2 n=1 Tax=Alligator sinensis TaxID=38654 RepID=A0A3Q0FLN8_ALLSI|nr:tapasin-related protein-like isoform X2 [Alligator sinensis]